MGEVVCNCGIQRESGYLYFINKDGNAARVKMARKGQKTDKTQEVVHECNITREEGYLYYIDKGGNAAKTKMARRG